MGMVCTTCLMAIPALAITHAENTSCKGPSKIYFAKKDFEWRYASTKHASVPCLATYRVTALSSSDGHADDWAPYSKFQSQLVPDPQANLSATLEPLIPAGAIPVEIDLENPNDIVRAYRVKEIHQRYEILRFMMLRALKQSDQTVRIYKFEISMQANTHAEDGTKYNVSVAQHAYEHFNKVVNKNRASWLQAIKMLDTQE